MMEDWTDIIGEELENIEEPLPADDWSVLQQKYAAAQRRKKVAAFAWAGGITSVAAAIALVLLLVRPDVTSVIPEQTASVIPDPIGDLIESIAETLPSTEEIVPIDSNVVEHTIDTVLRVAPSVQKKVSVPVDFVKKTVDDVLVAENHTEEILSENTEAVFDVIRDTTSSKDKLLADASTTNKKDSSEDAYTQLTDAFGFDDFPEDEPRRRRRLISWGMSGSISGTPVGDIILENMDASPPPNHNENLGSDNNWDGGDILGPSDPPEEPGDPMNPGLPEESPGDSVNVDASKARAQMKRTKRSYDDSYEHDLPVSIGLSARFHLSERLTFNTGLNYTMYRSTRTRYSSGLDRGQTDIQRAHYIGIPLRLDWLIADRKNFNLYVGAGMQVDKCLYATVGNERLYEKQVLVGLNGSMGLQINISPKVGLYFEPEVYYALNEGTIETSRSDEPNFITARGGLRFKF